jgi:hypothetical protein
MYTEYSKVLNFFRGQVSYAPNTDLRQILETFVEIKTRPDDLTAARYLIGQYHEYNELLAQANVHVK